MVSRFSSQKGVEDDCIKSIIRGGFKRIWPYTPHHFSGFETTCGANGKNVPSSPHIEDKSNLKFAHIKHFFTKTAEEFREKITRFYPDLPVGMFAEKVRSRIYEFFEYNLISYEKLRVFKEIMDGKDYAFFYSKLFESCGSYNFIYGGEYITFKSNGDK